ncbi:hypothetical protein C1645_811510 [Glomus cerebriforme]|uniref:Uncharacterized protein n=1 Tax=Glomus cerebriforme TaxID=658196 RepID=A0A397TMN7_9GLOM|nr:hypothetical protein C1645_811510 [Glomus cerebriforme]
MSQKHNANKKQGFRRVLKPVFVNASELPISQDHDNLTENPMTQRENEECLINTNTISEFSSDKKFPIFNNCHFNNVTFKI